MQRLQTEIPSAVSGYLYKKLNYMFKRIEVDTVDSNMRKLKPDDIIVLYELVENSKISDRKLAKKIGVSQPTATRKRTKLEREELIEYTAIPNFEKLGFEILVFSFVHYNLEIRRKLNKGGNIASMIATTLSNNPHIIFASSGRGLGMEGIAISIHKTYSDYVKFRRQLEDEWGEYVSSIDDFVISLKTDNIPRQFTFKHLAKFLKNMTKNAYAH